ncbi:Golgi membrane protein 1 isoform X1 [Ictalurus furcatus]|uniref:Golgi membrane protein 1 isoform X1 n=1 Tax=Ictalurus furcatus TaxID=66913 RepID=UPI0023500E84|nr:Golgi membrane protein 1 isoform X1 [Ictalurus furcatus]XP_053480385.1 Golgi membrane protein 1 isoform X1 [Ictalurus furcatus]
MIGALVNVRRGARSPPLLTVTLVACILLFGFNYWVSSSRNVELQTKLLELEEAVRRAAAERAREQVGRTAAEEQVRRQTEQLALLEGAHQRRQQSALSLWKQEKESLLLNISSTAKTVQDMKNQMKSLREDLSKVQKELQSCQNNMNTLNKKLTYDMTQCNTQILAQKEECNEKVAAAKLEVQKKYEKQNAAAAAVQPGVDATQKAVVSKPVSEVLAGNDSAENAGKPLKREPAPGTKPKTDDHLETNEIPQDQAVLTANDSDKLELPSIPLLPKQNSTLNSLTNAMEGVMDIKGGDSKDADALLDAAAVANVKEEEDAIEYDNEGEIEKRLSKLKDDKAAAQEFDEELADYNGDDENEPEFEADKQAELAKV